MYWRDMHGSQLSIPLFQSAEVPEPFRKANVAIHIASLVGALTLQQQKMFDAFIKNAAKQMSQKDRIWFEYPVKDLVEDVGLNSNNREYVKDVINSLISTVVSWDHMNEKREWNSCGLLAGVKISRGVCQYTFADNMRQLLTKPEVYTSIDMRISKRFKRGHAYSLWQNIVRYSNLGMTARQSVAKWRELVLGMDSHSGSYAQYKVFKSRVLIPSLAEINDVAEHNVELIEIKSGRTVSELQFTVKSKVATSTVKTAQDVDPDVFGEVTALGVPAVEAKHLIAEYGRDRVRVAVQYTEARSQKRNSPSVDNKGAYFKKALAGGWQSADAGRTGRRDGVPDASAKQAELVARLLAHRAGEARAYFYELEPSEQTRLLGDYNAQQAATILKVAGAKVSTKAAEHAFFSWLARNTWGEPTDSDLLSFIINKLPE